MRQDFVKPSLCLPLAGWILGGLLGTAVAGGDGPPEIVERLDRHDLLLYRAPDGRLARAAERTGWERRRAEIVAGMRAVMGSLPGDERRVPLDVRVEEEVDLGTYIRRRISYRSEPDARTPAYLCLPKSVLGGEQRAPAVLCLHPTDNKVGHQNVVGIAGRPGRQYAAELAERGYVTLAPSYPHLAKYWPNLGKLGYESGTMKAIWDNIRGLDLLETHRGVDASRGFGVIGHSLGGHNAIFTAVFDARISVLATSCGFDSFLDYYDGRKELWEFGRGWCQIRYMPKLSNYRGRLSEIPFDFPELLGALAPRPVFVSAPQRDSNFRWRSVERCVSAARPVYRLLGAEGALRATYPDVEHDFPEPQRQAAYRVIDSVLRRAESTGDPIHSNTEAARD